MSLLMIDTSADTGTTANSTAAVRSASSSSSKNHGDAAAAAVVALQELEQQLADLEETWQAVLPDMQLSH
jgi:predicted RNase H-like nuclease (RuvC/YqgF family)